MKRIILILFVSLVTLYTGAQVKQEVIASAGGDNSAPDLSIAISWTLGETIIPNYAASDNSLILTHVFQYKVIITNIEENINTPIKVTVYPNPTSENINISFEEPADAEITLLMINSQGKPVKTDVIEAMTVEKMLNLQDLPSGIYYLKLTKGKLVNVYKVVKL
ncbi:MAG: T9SS type A sorting domain-containing protein [Bacteroidia bacterium]|jgi:hypothetical protein|nr:T9SS type A sorting domain-containing protein [Bacteroidia bacterium]